ncbi:MULTISPECIES: preprotein translocase subunit SecA [Sutterella]|uniref:preprotein translocase subunit SecA n=2 Tax=Sutterellaceae TaxID=995019 RepID=UPI000EC86CF0|nr:MULTISPECIES: preprotein translocase subunit SecA [Sutterella]MBD8911982.1 preprotein translocase subunit SecA [Sutterella wadsworthensis]MBS6231566.1 preprotein translocase subunit SecA [Sutterella wadsworthensis]MBT9622348.1 preprotein translocase subunit SecA [Sutterella wadsworthensis]MDR3927125.1 preprotein translocase subunit SecA [Sutterella sp.]MDR3967145.1 preprotein translocase subunit SecA [Sutterella sp.]
MFDELLTKIFGSRNERLIKQYRRQVAAINKLEPAMEALSDAELQAKTQEFRDRIAKGATTDELLTEAFAVVREASKRVLGMRHFDVQLIGGMVLNDGKIAEMRTGEGKTLTATLAVYLNALAGKGVHVVTVNDYLASRDADWMGRLYHWLGLSVGKILSQQDTAAKKEAYAADITYGTNNEFGFDYLRDNMEYDVSARRQRGLYFAIVDEVDSILIDEARTPLIISGPADDNTDLYLRINEIPPLLTRQQEEKGEGDYWVDEKAHQVYISESGHVKLEKILAERGLVGPGESLYSPKNIILMHHLMASLKAHTLFKRDQQYVVQDGEIVIVDEFTGRLMPGRRWSEGIHQAVEAKEGVRIQHENQTMASITFQNYFRMYEKLSGMTGTADTEAYEFQDIYGLETVVIPTHRKMIRIDEQDKVYRTVTEKYQAIVEDVKACHAKGQPVLLGTTSIENSELLSQLLTKEGIEHNVLNAKQHEREAQIVLDAGRPGMVTIATNMAGRGTDIVLGGGINKAVGAIEADETLSAEEKAQRIAEVKSQWQKLHDEVVAAGGLRIIGSERHESRRIDNQLRGRAGRQGDPGSSCFYLSMEDQLLRIFGGDRMRAIADRLKLEPGVAIESKMLTRMIESAQRKVEGRNYDIRKQLLEFDDVQNDQRHEIYGLRNEILEATDCSELIKNLREGYFTDLFRSFVPADTVEEQWDLDALNDKLKSGFGIEIDFKKMLDADTATTDEDLLKALIDRANEIYEAKETLVGHDAFAAFGRSVLLQVIDQLWRQHIAALDALRQGIYLRGYAQKQPKQEYKREAFTMFEQLLDSIRETTTTVLMRVEIKQPEEAQAAAEDNLARGEARADASHLADADASQGLNAPNDQGSSLDQLSADENARLQAAFRHCGRNDPCPCGSGKKFKDCHGRLR